MNNLTNVLITNLGLIMMFMFAFVCFNNACVINVLAAIVKHNKLNVNDLQKCYSLLLLHEIVYDIHKEQSAARL